MNIDYLQDHIASPRFSGLLYAPSVDHTCANRSCGDSIRLTLHIDGETVSGVGWNAKGCTLSRAGASIVSEMVHGATLSDALAITPQDVLDAMEVAISPARVKCALLGLRALHESLTIWQMRS